MVNFNDTVPISLNFGASGTPFRDGDGDGDGLVNFNDTVPLSLNSGASLTPLTFDFGDAPETGTSFPTTLANSGAQHIATSNTLWQGADRDSEADGQPSADASGDGMDENGIAGGMLDRGTFVGVTVTSSGAGIVNAWIDFNQDGDWDDPGEQVLIDEPVVASANSLQVAVPSGATLGSTFARFRLTSSAGYSYFGLAPNGEVEDYQLTVVDPALDMQSHTGEEPPSTMSVRSIPKQTLPAHLIGIPAPAFVAFEDVLSQFSTGKTSRPIGR